MKKTEEETELEESGDVVVEGIADERVHHVEQQDGKLPPTLRGGGAVDGGGGGGHGSSCRDRLWKRVEDPRPEDGSGHSKEFDVSRELRTSIYPFGSHIISPSPVLNNFRNFQCV